MNYSYYVDSKLYWTIDEEGITFAGNYHHSFEDIESVGDEEFVESRKRLLGKETKSVYKVEILLKKAKAKFPIVYRADDESVVNDAREALAFLRAKVNEVRQQEQDEKQREQDILDELKQNITSSDNIPGKTVTKTLGIVSGSDSYLEGGIIGEGFGQKAGNLYSQAAIKNATHKMAEAAVKLGANAVISVKTSTTQGALDMIKVMVTGTAVVVDVADTNNGGNVFSAADEIMKFKKMLDLGVITQEEFEEQKKKLLGI